MHRAPELAAAAGRSLAVDLRLAAISGRRQAYDLSGSRTHKVNRMAAAFELLGILWGAFDDARNSNESKQRINEMSWRLRCGGPDGHDKRTDP
jgi:hypothetical protein